MNIVLLGSGCFQVQNVASYHGYHIGAPAATKRSTITVVTGSLACMEIETRATLGWRQGSWANNADDDNVAKHGGYTSANTKSCSLGLQRISLTFNIHVKVN